MYLKPIMSATIVKWNEESNQLEEGPKVTDLQWLKTFPKSVLLTINVMWTMKCLQNLMCSPRCELAVIAGPGENSVVKGEEGGGGKIGRDRWFAAEGSKKQGRVWPWRQMSSRNNTKVLCFNWSGLFRCCHKKSRQESRVGVSSGKSTLEELFTFALISIFSGAACEGKERGKELKREA